MKITKKVNYKVNGNIIFGDIKIVKSKVVSDRIYFRPNIEELKTMMGNDWSAYKIQELINELTSVKEFIESIEVANELNSNGEEVIEFEYKK